MSTSIADKSQTIKTLRRFISEGNPIKRPYKAISAIDLGGFSWTGAKYACDADLNKLINCLKKIGFWVSIDNSFYSNQDEYRAEFYGREYSREDPIPGTFAYSPDMATAVFVATDRLVKCMAEWEAEDATNA